MDLLLSCCTAAAPAAALAAAPANTFTWSHHIITIIWPYGRMMAWSHKYNHMISFKSFPGSPTPTLYRSPVRKSSSVGIGLPKDCPLQPQSIHWSGWMLDKIVHCKFSKNLQIKTHFFSEIPLKFRPSLPKLPSDDFWPRRADQKKLDRPECLLEEQTLCYRIRACAKFVLGFGRLKTYKTKNPSGWHYLLDEASPEMDSNPNLNV